MKMIKNKEHAVWCRALQRYAARDCGMYMTDVYNNVRYLNIRELLHTDVDAIKDWIRNNPEPPREIPDPDYVALVEKNQQLEDELSKLKEGHVTKEHLAVILKTFQNEHDYVPEELIVDVLDRYITHLVIRDKINNAWRLAEEDEHIFTDEGLIAPAIFPGSDIDYNMLMLNSYFATYQAHHKQDRETRYYEALYEHLNKMKKEKEESK